jgi:hypothetical protein
VADLQERTDAEPIAMVRAYTDKRLAAGRPVPTDATLIIG